MNSRRTILFLGLGILIAILIFLLNKQQGNYTWDQHYLQENEDPYGTLYFSELVQQSLSLDTLHLLDTDISNSLPIDTTVASNYLFIGEGLNFSAADEAQLLDFVAEGNTAFISCRVLPNTLVETLYPEPCDSMFWYRLSSFEDTLVGMSFKHPDLYPDSNFYYQFYYQKKLRKYNWQYISHIYFCDQDNGLTALGQINEEKTNFASVKYGEGTFYIHTTPLAFTNLHLLSKEGVTYSQLILSHLNEGPVYWDENSRITEDAGELLNNNQPRNKQLNSKSPLQFILNQPALAWAWYLLLAMGLLFLIFRAKRKQRVIPVLEPNKNTSLQFVSTIGRLYFMQSNHKQLALQKMKLLQVFIREKYNFNTRELDDDLAKKLAVRSEIPLENIQQIFTIYNNVKTAPFVSENTLIKFHKVLENFYQNCK